MELDAMEQRLLERSRDRASTVRRKRLAVFTAGIMLVAVWLLFTLLESRTLAMVVFFVYVLVTAIERWAYANAVLGYKSLVRKLHDRLGDLERENEHDGR